MRGVPTRIVRVHLLDEANYSAVRGEVTKTPPSASQRCAEAGGTPTPGDRMRTGKPQIVGASLSQGTCTCRAKGEGAGDAPTAKKANSYAPRGAAYGSAIGESAHARKSRPSAPAAPVGEQEKQRARNTTRLWRSAVAHLPTTVIAQLSRRAHSGGRCFPCIGRAADAGCAPLLCTGLSRPP